MTRYIEELEASHEVKHAAQMVEMEHEMHKLHKQHEIEAMRESHAAKEKEAKELSDMWAET